MEFLRRTFTSKKFWAFAVTFVTLLSTAMADGIISSEEGRNIAGLAVGYVLSVAFEDGMSRRNTNQTTVSTPSDNVTVTTTDAPPTPPIVNRIGG